MALRKTAYEQRMDKAYKAEMLRMDKQEHQDFIQKAMLYGCPTKELAELLWMHISTLKRNSHSHG